MTKMKTNFSLSSRLRIKRPRHHIGCLSYFYLLTPVALSNNKVGIVNDKGRCVLPCKYKRIKILNKHSAIVYTLKGNKIIDICNQ